MSEATSGGEVSVSRPPLGSCGLRSRLFPLSQKWATSVISAFCAAAFLQLDSLVLFPICLGRYPVFEIPQTATSQVPGRLLGGKILRGLAHQAASLSNRRASHDNPARKAQGPPAGQPPRSRPSMTRSRRSSRLPPSCSGPACGQASPRPNSRTGWAPANPPSLGWKTVTRCRAPRRCCAMPRRREARLACDYWRRETELVPIRPAQPTKKK